MDSFDDIWRNRFNEGKVPASDWNTPDESVWEGVSAHIEQQKSRRRALLLWLISGLLGLLLLIGILGYHRTNKLSNAFGPTDLETSTTYVPTENETGEIIEIPNLLKESPVEDEKTFSSTSDAPVSPIDGVSETAENREQRIKDNKQQSPLPIENGGSTKPVQPSILNGKEETQKDDKVPARINRKSAKEPLPITQSINRLVEISTIPVLAFELPAQRYNMDVNVPDPGFQSAGDQKNGKKITIAIIAGGAYLNHRISNNYQDDLSPFDFQYSDDFGWQAGLQLAFPVNTWMDVWTGIQYEQVNSTSGHNSDLAYDPGAETSGPNNQYALSLATPYGLSDASFILTRSNDVGTDEVDMQVDFESRHQLQNWSVPLGITLYPLKKERKIIPSFQLGLGVNYLNKISNKLKAIDTHHADIQHDNTNYSTVYRQPDFNNWHLDARLGAGFQYRLTNTLQIRLNYNWSRGLSPVFEDNANKYSTSIDRHALLIGITSRL